LVFVNVSDKPLAFEDQFSFEALSSLQAASDIFDSEVLIAHIQCHMNWKLAYENLRDSLHPRFLHPQTVYQLVKFQVHMSDEDVAQAKEYHAKGSSDRSEHLQTLRSFSSGGLNEPIAQMPSFAWHENVERYGKDDWYLNWLVYPNLHIASGSGGHSFIIEHHQPISASRTDLTIYYVTARKKRRYATSAAVLLSHLEGAEKVLREDIDVMEQIQSGLRPGSPRAQLGDFESTNMAIERWYMDVMEGRHVL
jgi:phenylpropionate dioxygenase-like ring-hydroxylating dioxygenase large terminal subunit